MSLLLIAALTLPIPTAIRQQPRSHHRIEAAMSGPAVIASWYDDSGQTASGRHYPHGFASLMFASRWGLRVIFCRAARRGCSGPRVVGTLADHGPYVAGRSFDLGPGLKAALGCSDLCSVRFRVAG